MQNDIPQSNDALPDKPPPKGSCCQKVAGFLATAPRLTLELSALGLRLRFVAVLDSAR